jgi:hypothetical protein
MLLRRGRDDAFRLGEMSFSPSGVSPLGDHGASSADGLGSTYQHSDPDTGDNIRTGYDTRKGYDLTPWQAEVPNHAFENMADNIGTLPTVGGSAGSGGHGTFIGAMVDSDVAIYTPLNIAISAYRGEATATQSNAVGFNLDAGQIGGVSGGGGFGNVAGGGGTAAMGNTTHSGEAPDSGPAVLHPGTASFFGSAGHAGDGGDGIFFGAMLDMDVAIYAPVNIAISFGGSVTATQYNSVVFDQGASQVAGIGGGGGGDNKAVGGSGLWSLLHADTVHTGGGASGNGGDGVFVGVMNDNDLSVYAPINIAIGGSAISSAGPLGELHPPSDWLSDMVDGGGRGSMDLSYDIAMLTYDLAHLT